MFKITQGTPNEFQILIFYGIVMFVFMAPLIILAASLLGWLTHPVGPDANTTQKDAQLLKSQS